MVLSREQVKKRMSDIKENWFSYMILDIENIQYGGDEKRFRYSIEVLNLVNTVNWANRFYEKSGSKNKIETDILYKVIEANLTDRSFTDKELKAYYNMMVNLEDFYQAINKFKEVDIYIPYEAEFIILGLTHDEYDNLNEREKEKLHEYYGEAYCDLRFKNTSVDNFIVKAKEIIKSCIQKRLIKCA
ncbi:hypothetical protein GTQ40_15770 [Flavobacteriaceae bacterium R38]|nr:hypothetical protein [Flavobacteriaceae bacterium R38]